MSSSHVVRASDAVFANLDSEVAFAGLTLKEAEYSLALSQASWGGQGIVALQASVESPGILLLIRLMLEVGGRSSGSSEVDALATVLAFRSALAGVEGVGEEAVTSFLAYAAMVIDNGGNYKGFGDSKFIPGVSADVVSRMVESLAAEGTAGATAATLRELWGGVKEAIYDVSPSRLHLGLAPEGCSSYYSAGYTAEDAARVKAYLSHLKVTQPYNSRVFLRGERHYEIRLASGETASPFPPSIFPGPHEGVEFEGSRFSIVRGDHAPLMARVADHLDAARAHAANSTQEAMLTLYASSFRGGSQIEFEEGSKLWVKDTSPVVESYLGFIESYRDPCGVRGEFEGFVAVVNKALSAKFTSLVDNAASLLKLLPWGPDFEKDVFRRPDFTALDVITFSGSGVPAGINIPNFDSVRETVGFKNVSLSNVLSARSFKERITFLGEEDQELFKRCVGPAFEVQVGIHEMVGHGSGKLLTETAPGVYNFDVAHPPKHPLTGAPAVGHYALGQTWDSVFGGVASAMEECRAEAVGIFLCVIPEILAIFGHAAGKEEGEDIIYANWLNMARAGLLALQFYSPATRKWGQAHCQARFALLRLMLEAGGGLAELEGFPFSATTTTSEAAAAASATNANSASSSSSGSTSSAAEANVSDRVVRVKVSRAAIHTVGIPAVSAFLTKLQVIKATAAVEEGKVFFDAYTSVPQAWLPLRELVIEARRPRPMFVQPHLERVPEGSAVAAAGSGGGIRIVKGEAQTAIQMKCFPATLDGALAAFISRTQPVDEDLLALWRKSIKE